MTLNSRKSYLNLKVIWKDDDMFELAVEASNSDFFGRTEVYGQSESLMAFSKSLVGFPRDRTILFYEAGEKDSFSYFSMKYYPVGRNGLVGIEINIESNVPTEYRPEEKSKLKLEIIVEPSAIDIFQKSLFIMAKNEDGTATLYGQNEIT